MADIAASAKIEKFSGAGFSQLHRLIEIPKGEKTGIRTDRRPVELQLDGAVKTDSQVILACFTHRVLPLFTGRA